MQAGARSIREHPRSNRFLVSGNPDTRKLWVGYQSGLSSLSRADAFNLAAWLVRVAAENAPQEPDEPNFFEVLKSVLEFP